MGKLLIGIFQVTEVGYEPYEAMYTGLEKYRYV